jgi:hypothetical protein
MADSSPPPTPGSPASKSHLGLGSGSNGSNGSTGSNGLAGSYSTLLKRVIPGYAGVRKWRRDSGEVLGAFDDEKKEPSAGTLLLAQVRKCAARTSSRPQMLRERVNSLRTRAQNVSVSVTTATTRVRGSRVEGR